MTNEELDRLEALATHSRNNRYAFTAIEPFNLLSLIALARVGLARQQGTIGHMDNGKTALTAAVLQVSALPKPGGE